MTGPVALRFRLYAVVSGGAALWVETHENVELTDGIASVLLGSLVTLPGDAFSTATRYLEITVNGLVLAPRLHIASVPFALEANRTVEASITPVCNRNDARTARTANQRFRRADRRSCWQECREMAESALETANSRIALMLSAVSVAPALGRAEGA